MYGQLRLGLCCINTVLRKQNIFCSRTCIRKNFTIDKAMDKARHNILDLIRMIEWNHSNNISCLRVSSDLFPHFTDDQTEHYTIDFARCLLKQAGDLANQYGHRILMHPGQFNQVGAINPKVFSKTVQELVHQASILDAMGIDNNGVLIVHGGGVYHSKMETMNRWVDNFHQLPDNVKNRLVIENCERNYSVEDCLEIGKRCHIPVVLDLHHYDCWSHPQLSLKQLIPQVIETWQSSHRRIIMHLSEQAPHLRLGAHSDYVENIPHIIFHTIRKYSIEIDLEIEAKMKEQAIFHLYRKYYGGSGGEVFSPVSSCYPVEERSASAHGSLVIRMKMIGSGGERISTPNHPIGPLIRMGLLGERKSSNDVCVPVGGGEDSPCISKPGLLIRLKLNGETKFPPKII